MPPSFVVFYGVPYEGYSMERVDSLLDARSFIDLNKVNSPEEGPYYITVLLEETNV